jgi:hypothetical protein
LARVGDIDRGHFRLSALRLVFDACYSDRRVNRERNAEPGGPADGRRTTVSQASAALFFRREFLMNYSKRLRDLGCEPPPETPDCDIEAIERAVGVPLRRAYRDFLSECGGWWHDILCPVEEPTPFGEDHWITSFHDAGEVEGLLNSMIAPRNMIVIGTGHFAKYTCLSIAGIDHGSVYALDGEFRAYWSDEEFHQRFNAIDESIEKYLTLRRNEMLPEKPVGYECLYLLAPSFADFLARCKPCLDDA